MIGKIISHYKILEKLGEGGMGVVYKAEDLILKRDVAIKFLPHQVAASEEDRERFKIEARAAATLNHPNIATIHAIEEIDDDTFGGERQIFIVMEYIDGQELKQRIKNGPLQMDELLTIASQIADGLQTAHEKGVTHCDIKSTNIMLTNHHRVKIMDFGLAKIKGQMRLARTGTTGGTIAYMSPEQARGVEVDHRTDIWSFGVVLYEMLTGHLPFTGEYEQAIVYSILNEEPEPASGYRDDAPMDLERIVTKTLAKNPAERYQHMDEMVVDIRSINKISPPHSEKKMSRRVISKPLWGGLAFMLLITTLIMAYLSTHHKEKDFQITYTLPLTTAPGLEQDPAWSPEGTRIAYASDESGNMDVWVRQITVGQKLNLTRDHSGYDGKPAWSPNGEWIAFTSERDGGGIFLLPALGGIPKRVVSLSFAPSLSYVGAIPPICWSPDGKKLIYANAGLIYVVPAGGGTPVPIPLPHTRLIVGFSEPAFSPDGKRIACTGVVGPGVATSQIWSVRIEGTNPLPITSGTYYDINPIWSSDGQQLFFISDRSGNRDVWWVPINIKGKLTGPPRSLTTGAGVGAISLSRDGTKMAYSKVVEYSNIWSIPITPNHNLTLDQAQPLTSENNYIEVISVSPDGRWIAFDSNRSGNMDIWLMNIDGSELRQLTTNKAHDWFGSWSPDGNQIFFHSLRQGNRDIFMMPVAGGEVIPLTNHPAEDFAPVVSPDGETIAFTSNRSGNMDVWVMQRVGGEPTQLTFHATKEFILLWSPDGKRLVFGSTRTGFSELFFISLEGGDPIQLTHGAWSEIYPLFWSAQQKIIYAYGQGGPDNQGANLWVVSEVDGNACPLLDFKGSLIEPGIAVSSDGKRLYFPLIERVGDLWMAELSANP